MLDKKRESSPMSEAALGEHPSLAPEEVVKNELEGDRCAEAN